MLYVDTKCAAPLGFLGSTARWHSSGGAAWTERVAQLQQARLAQAVGPCRVSGVLSTHADLGAFVESFVLLGRKGVSGVPAVLQP